MREKLAVPGESVIVGCTMDRATELEWRSPSGEKVRTIQSSEEVPADNQPYAISATENDGKVASLELHVPKASLNFAGDYSCAEIGTPAQRTFQLRMKECMCYKPIMFGTVQ